MQNMFQGGFQPFQGRQVGVRGLTPQGVRAVPQAPVPHPMSAPEAARVIPLAEPPSAQAAPPPGQVARDPRTGRSYPVLAKGDSRGSCPVCRG